MNVYDARSRKDRSQSRHRGVGVVALVAVVLLAGCGGAETAPPDGSAASPEPGSEYAAVLEGLYRGTYAEPNSPTTTDPPRDKTIWVIPSGLNAEVNVLAVDGVDAAATALGWEVRVYDGKFSPTTQLMGIREALAARADGIVTAYVDCAGIRNGLVEAASAGVPTINIAGEECEDPAYTDTVSYPGYDDYVSYLEAFGRAQARYAIAKTAGRARVILSTQTDLGSIRAMSEGVRAEIAACAECEVLGDAEFVSADFGPTLQSKVSQQLLMHPDANVFIASYDAILTSGGAQALKASGRLDDLLVVGSEGSADGIEMIRQHSGMDVCLGYDPAMDGYSAVNYLVLLLSGTDTSNVDNGVGLQACDADHNLPAAGRSYKSGIDYEASYRRLWGLE